MNVHLAINRYFKFWLVNKSLKFILFSFFSAVAILVCLSRGYKWNGFTDKAKGVSEVPEGKDEKKLTKQYQNLEPSLRIFFLVVFGTLETSFTLLIYSIVLRAA